jgi:hypothetical protein
MLHLHLPMIQNDKKNKVKGIDIILQSSHNLSLTNASHTTIQVKQFEMKTK